MVELFIFDKNLNPLGLIDDFFSLSWIRRYHKAGEFELHLALTPENLNLLQKDNIVYKPGDIEAGYIEYRNLKQDTEGKEYLAIKGKFLTGYLGRRIIWGTETLNDTAEKAMRTLVNKNAISPTNPDRKIPLLTLGNLKNYPETVNYQVSYKNLLEELENLSNISNLGYRTMVDLTDKKLVFGIYKGRDLTAKQTESPPAIFSNEFENVFEQEYTDSLHNYRNIALVAGAGEGTERKRTIIGEGQGLDRYELYVDARDLQDKKEDETVIPEEEYLKMLESRGKTKLAEYAELKTFEGKITAKGNLKYKQDFDLGDIVTILNKKWRVTIDTRITEILEVYESGNCNIYVTFGNEIPTLIDKIKQEMR